MYSQSFGTKECDDYLIHLHKNHTDTKTRYWIKSPNTTRRDISRSTGNSVISEPRFKSKVAESIWRLKNKK